MTEQKPAVGMPATYNIGSDSYPVTVVRVSPSGHLVDVQFDKFEADKEAGHDYYTNQKWKVIRNPEGRIERFGRTKTGLYVKSNRGCGHLKFGVAVPYQDPGF